MRKDTASIQPAHDYNNNSFFKAELLVDGTAYIVRQKEIRQIIQDMKTAIKKSDNVSLANILNILEQNSIEMQQAFLYAVRKTADWGYGNRDPILTAIGEYNSGYKSEILKTLLSSEWIIKNLKDHTYGGDAKVTALHIACLYNNEDAITQLTAAGFNPIAKDAKGRTPKDYGSTQIGFYPELEFQNGTLIKNQVKTLNANTYVIS